MATKEQITAIIAKRLVADKVRQVRLTDIVAAFQQADQVSRDRFVVAVANDNAPRIGQAVQEMVRAWARAEAVTEADAIVADDQLSLDELDRVFGPF